MRLRDLAKYLGGLALAIVLLAWVLRGTEVSAIRAHLASVDPAGLALGLGAAAALNLGHNVFRVLRWRVLLEPVRARVPLRPMFDAVILGYMASWTMPGRLGELVRPALLAGRERLPLGACLGSVFADRLLDGLAVLAFFAVGVATTPLAVGSSADAARVRQTAVVLVSVVAVMLFALFLAARGRRGLERWFASRSGLIAWCARAALAVVRGTEALSRPGLFVRALGHTALAWLMILAGTWVGIRALGVDVPPGAVAVILPLLALGIAVPTPGGAGGYHLAMKFGLVQLFGIDEAAAVAAGLMLHVAIVVPTVLLGAALLVVDRIPLKDLIAAAREVRALGRAPREAAPGSDALERSP